MKFYILLQLLLREQLNSLIIVQAIKLHIDDEVSLLMLLKRVHRVFWYMSNYILPSLEYFCRIQF
jgi:hypothetical protein